MEVRMCFELGVRDESGNLTGKFGLALTFDGVSTDYTYSQLAEAVDLTAVLRMSGFEGVIRVEDTRVITPEEYDEKYERNLT